MINCKECNKLKEKNNFYKGRKVCKDCINNKIKEDRRETKRKLIVYKGSKCEKCGLKFDGKNQYVFDFHHINPENKSFGLAEKKNLKFYELIKEVDKCIILCKNCHAEYHYYNG